MTNRTREYDSATPNYFSWTESTVEAVDCYNPDYCTSSTTVLTHSDEGVYPIELRKGVIADTVFPKYRRSRHGNIRVPLTIKTVLGSIVSTEGPSQLKPVKEVQHTKIHIKCSKDDMFPTYESSSDTGVAILSSSISAPMTPALWLGTRYGFPLDFWFSNSPEALGLTRFYQPDWFSLQDSFNEAVDSFMPSSFLLGEDMAEYSIFKDALLLAMNPSKAIKNFVKTIFELGYDKKTLGQIRHLARSNDHISFKRDKSLLVRQATRKGINADLSYKFGVKPAISDIVGALNAHRKVNERLAYLSSHRGQYVPIRVRKRLTADFSSNPHPAPTGYMQIYERLEDAYTLASIFAQGRVREDITIGSQWVSYAEYFGLNKIVGLAWELIPFTFVVDWFTNAQERINQMTRIRLSEGPFVNIGAIGSSLKTVSEVSLNLQGGIITSGAHAGYTMTNPVGPVILAKCERSQYARYPFIPDTSGVLDLSTLGSFHAITGGELLLQRSRL